MSHSKINTLLKIYAAFFVACTFLISCRRDPIFNLYKTQNVFIVVMDGARYSETWGDSTHQYIPRMANDLLPQGVVYTNFGVIDKNVPNF